MLVSVSIIILRSSSQNPVGKNMRRYVFYMLLKLLQTQWKNKEKMMQHIMVIVSFNSIQENPYSLEDNKYVVYTFLETLVGKIESMTYDLMLILPH